MSNKFEIERVVFCPSVDICLLSFYQQVAMKRRDFVPCLSSEEGVPGVDIKKARCQEIDGWNERLTNEFMPLDLRCNTRLAESFYDIPCELLAQRLLGKVLVRRLNDGTVLKGKIVETECYLGGEDKASHSYNGRRTPRNTPMYMKPGTVYVYFTYGMYFCFNISSQGDGAAVLIRAVDPLEGLDFMCSQRLKKRNSMKKASATVQSLKPFELCSGPGKLCISFSIDEKTCNKQDLSIWDGLWIEDTAEPESGVAPCDIIISKRIGIDSVGGEWVEKPLRYYVFGNRSVSKRDKLKEKERVAFN